MNAKNKIIISYGLWIFDIISIAVSFLMGTYIRFGNFKDMGDKRIHFLVGVTFALLWTFYLIFIPQKEDFTRRGVFAELISIIQTNVVVILVTQTVMYFLKWADIFSRYVMIYFAIINVILTFILHRLLRRIVKIYYKSDLTKVKVLVITEESLKDEVVERLSENLDLSYQIIDVMCIETMPDDYREKVMQTAFDEVFIFAPSQSQRRIGKEIAFFDEMGVICHCGMGFTGMGDRKGDAESFGDYPVITYSHINISHTMLFVKRFIDILGGITGCLILLIMLPFIAIAIKSDSKGPVFFSQMRIGRNGRRFKIWKFRSMYIDAEERKKELVSRNEVSGLMFKMENDPRITKVGRFLRKTSLDEFPQFINILKGDMSLVGTRPPTEDEFEKYNSYYRRRISMTPGLTGLWQVSGRSDIDDFDDVVKLDLKYIDEWSLLLDIKILFKTVWVVFTARGSK